MKAHHPHHITKENHVVRELFQVPSWKLSSMATRRHWAHSSMSRWEQRQHTKHRGVLSEFGPLVQFLSVLKLDQFFLVANYWLTSRIKLELQQVIGDMSRFSETMRKIPLSTMTFGGICILAYILQIIFNLKLSNYTMYPYAVIYR